MSPDGQRDVEAAGGARAWLRQQLQPYTIDDSTCDDYLKLLADQSDSIREVYDDILHGRRADWQQLAEVNTGMLIRATWSRRQLLASLEEFWGNHFNVTVPSDGIAMSRAHYQWTIRTNALGTFENLLYATSTHPSMLTYLNNRNSDRDHPNENQGRELLELHTVGLSAGFDEVDVLNSSRILTGLSVDAATEEFEYQPSRHWTGPVQVLDFSHSNSTAAGGLDVVKAYLHYLAQHPATARRICAKLATWFVADTPPPGLVDELTGVYQSTGGNITSILERIFASDAFWANAGGRTRRPFDAYVATIRRLTLTPQPGGLGDLQDMTVLEHMGQVPFGAPYPTGWPDVPQAWASPASTLTRWNCTLRLTDGYLDAVNRPDLKAFIFGTGPLPGTYGEAVDRIGVRLFGLPPNATHRQALLGFLGENADSVAGPNSSIFGEGLPYVVALLLDSPYLLVK